MSGVYFVVHLLAVPVSESLRLGLQALLDLKVLADVGEGGDGRGRGGRLGIRPVARAEARGGETTAAAVRPGWKVSRDTHAKSRLTVILT